MWEALILTMEEYDGPDHFYSTEAGWPVGGIKFQHLFDFSISMLFKKFKLNIEKRSIFYEYWSKDC